MGKQRAKAIKEKKAKIGAVLISGMALFDIVPESLFTMPERLGIVEWIEANRNLSPRYSALTGPWSRETAPYAVEVMEAVQDPDVRDITMVWPSQSTKSTTVENILYSVMAQQGVPTMLVLPEKKARDAWVQERFRPTIACSPGVAAHLSGRKRAITNARIDFKAAPLYLALSDSESDLSGKSCGVVLLDEADKFPDSTAKEGSPLTQTIARTTTFPRSKVIVCSTPTTPSGLTWKRYLESDQGQWSVKDPGNGEWHVWDFSRLKWDERPEGTSRAAWAQGMREGTVKVWYEFPSGAVSSKPAQKDSLNRSGKWIPQRPWIKSHRGFNLDSFAVWSVWCSFAEFAALFQEAMADYDNGDERALQHFTIHKRGKPYTRKTVSADADLIASREVETPRSVAPTGTSCVVVSCDVQDDRVVWLALSVNLTLGTLHVMDCGESRDSLGETVKKLKAQRWRGPDFDGCARVVLIDSGDGDWKEEVYGVCRSFKAGVLPVKGASHRDSGLFYKINTDTMADHGGRLVLVQTDTTKNLVYQKLRLGALTLFQGSASDKELVAQLTAEKRIQERGGMRWVCPVGRANHFWDCLTYAALGAILCGLIKKRAPIVEATAAEAPAVTRKGPVYKVKRTGDF
jgi:phage terminase large subunit GpA-like protein